MPGLTAIQTLAQFRLLLFLVLSIVLFQIHSLVQARDLLAVAVEHESLAAEEFADAPLGRLAPSRVINFRVDVGVKAVLLGLHRVPSGRRLLLHKAELDDRL